MIKCPECHVEVDPYPMIGWDTAVVHPKGTNIERSGMCTAEPGITWDVCTNCQHVISGHPSWDEGLVEGLVDKLWKSMNRWCRYLDGG